jgi:putative hydrolase of the HAD superfamily
MKYLILDVDGVIIHGYHHNPQHRRWWNENLQQDLGISPDLLGSEFFTKRIWDPIIRGEQDILPCLAEVLARIGSDVPAETLLEYWLTHDSVLNQPLIDRIGQLSQQGHICHLATNQEHRRARHLWTTLGLSRCFNQLFYSAQLGSNKPDPAFFRKVNEAISFNPAKDEVRYFDDSPDCVNSASAAGWTARIYNTLNDFSL